MADSKFIAFREVGAKEKLPSTRILNLAHVIDIRPADKDGTHTIFVIADGVTVIADIRFTEIMKDIPSLKYGFR